MLWVPLNLKTANAICQDRNLTDSQVADYFRGLVLGASGSFLVGSPGEMIERGFSDGTNCRIESEAKQAEISAKRRAAALSRKR